MRKILIPFTGLLDAHAGGDRVADDGVALELWRRRGRTDRERGTDGGYHANAHQKSEQFACNMFHVILTFHNGFCLCEYVL